MKRKIDKRTEGIIRVKLSKFQSLSSKHNKRGNEVEGLSRSTTSNVTTLEKTQEVEVKVLDHWFLLLLSLK